MAGTTLAEPDFQAQLADFIKRCPAGDGDAYAAWHTEFEAWCFVRCTDEQHERALELYGLHVLNENADA